MGLWSYYVCSSVRHQPIQRVRSLGSQEEHTHVLSTHCWYFFCYLDFKNLPYAAKHLMLNLVKLNYVLRWSIDEALASDYFHTDSTACCKTPILDKLTHYHEGNGLVSATESYLALKKTNQTHQLELAKYFHSINTNKNGIIL